jgi:hypothetical protein
LNDDYFCRTLAIDCDFNGFSTEPIFNSWFFILKVNDDGTAIGGKDVAES